MIVVQVTAENPNRKVYCKVDTTDKNVAAKAAFRYVYKRGEESYNELVHSTYVCPMVELDRSMIEILMSHVN